MNASITFGGPNVIKLILGNEKKFFYNTCIFKPYNFAPKGLFDKDT